MNNFHRIWFQNFRQSSNLFSQIWLKKRRTSFFSGICREIRAKFHKNSQKKIKMQKLTQTMKKFRKSETHFSFAKKMLTIFGWNFEIWAVQKYVNLVDLGESFPTSIYLQKSASIQPRTSPSKFEGKIQFIIKYSFASLILTPIPSPLHLGFPLPSLLQQERSSCCQSLLD